MKRKSWGPWFLCLLALVGSGFAASSHAESDWSLGKTLSASISEITQQLGGKGDGDLNFEEEDLNVQYGQYSETEVSLAAESAGSVQWNTIGSELPPGMELEETNANQILIFGTPKFTGLWCFTLGAQTEDGGEHAEELCYTGTADESAGIPEFSKESLLPEATAGQMYQQRIDVTTSGEENSYTGEIYDEENIPQGLQITQRDEDQSFAVKGRFAEEGLARFALKVTDANGVENSRQFHITINAKEQEYSCPAGYYYDRDLGYCVADNSTSCPDGTYWDADSNTCLQYPTPPPTVVCGPGEYYDPFLDQCVRTSYPRCPIGYRYNDFQNRCVRMAHVCPPGFVYNLFRNRCEARFPQHNCGPNERWDYTRDRCVRIHKSCRPGFKWDARLDRCVPGERPRDCRRDEVWDPRRQQCVPRSRICGPGEVFDPARNRCVRRDNHPNCPPGQFWNPRRNQCVPVNHPMPMPMPEPMPHPMPMPMPDPMPQPMPMPEPPPMPQPMPMPEPPPMPQPMPMPEPPPMPQPMPMPMPEPMPQPMPMPMPEPMPRPMPVDPSPRPMPNNPSPRPMPVDPGPRPMGMGRN